MWIRSRPVRALATVAVAVPTLIALTGPAPAAAADVATLTCAQLPDGPEPSPAPLAGFTATTPRRLVDTRIGTGGVDEPIGDRCTLRIDVDAANVPAQAVALSLSVTALGSRPGFLSVFPCSGGVPATSNLNTRSAGFPTPNLVVALPDAGRDVCIFSLFEAQLIVDLTGWWTDDGPDRFASISPVRAVDSRNDPGRARVPGGTQRVVELAGIVPADATAVVANLTVTEPVADGFLVAFPCGTAAPTASNLNFRAGESRAVAMIIGLDARARLCIQSNTDHHVIVDVSGYYAPAPQFGPAAEFRPIAGRRLADSRSGEGGWNGAFGDGTIRRLKPVNGLSFSGQSTAVIANVVATQASAPGFATLYPCDEDVPNSSAVNYLPGGESTNMVTVDLSAAGEICVFTLRGVHLVVDLFGVMTAPDGVLVERLSFGEFAWPEYRTAATDYAVECGDAPVELELDLLTSTTARINGVPFAGGVVDLPVDDDDLTWVQLRRGSATVNHWFRCVPDRFPRLDVERPGEPAAGWYLTTFREDADTDNFAVILDHYGAPVWYKRFDEPVVDLKRLPDGRLTLAPELGPRYGVDPERGYQIMRLSGTRVGEHLTVEEGGVPHPTDHHDYVPLPNGGRAMIAYPLLSGQNLSGIGFGNPDVIADNVIQEFDAAGNLVWSWTMSDDFFYEEATYPVRWPPFPGYAGGEVDVFHINSLGLVADGSGDYIVSGRHVDAVFRVDRATNTTEWIVGTLPPGTPQKATAQRLEIVGDPLGGPRRPHDARLDGSVLTLFDNRTDTAQPARAVAYEIDTTAGTATMLWQITEPQGRTSMGLGSARVAADGSVLVSWGAVIQPMFEEFDAARNSIMRITKVGNGVSYRIVKEPASAFSATVLRASAGGTVDVP